LFGPWIEILLAVMYIFFRVIQQFSSMGLVSCDTFVVLGNSTATGETIFGKNSDRPAGEVQEVLFSPGGSFTPGRGTLLL
jgi:hypothetical protein